jgi:hypothetical protein
VPDDQRTLQPERAHEFCKRRSLRGQVGWSAVGALRVAATGPVHDDHSKIVRELAGKGVGEMHQVAGEAVDHHERRRRAAEIDIVNALTTDFDELAARRQLRLDVARSVRGEGDKTKDADGDDNDQSEDDAHDGLALQASEAGCRLQLVLAEPRSNGTSDLRARIFLEKVPSLDGHFILIFPSATKLSASTMQNCARITVDE